MNLEQIRAKIDKIDDKIVKLLSSRMELALLTTKFKGSILDKQREKEVLANAKRASTGLLKPQMVEKLFLDILEESKELQSQSLKLAAFQGEHGAYSEIAIEMIDKSCVPIPCADFSEVFEGVKAGHFDFGVVPIENSIVGAVAPVNDLLIQSDLTIIAETYVPIHHCLLALPESDYREIRVVYSHPQVLEQCKGFISRNKLEARPYYDSAGAAMMLSEAKDKSAAVIASKLCSKIYGLEVLKENIQDAPSNYTRFVALSREKAEATNGNKCSIYFIVSHKAGSLFSILKIFKDAQINLTRIESHHVHGDPKKYAFILDFQGSIEDKKVKETLERVKSETLHYKFLGCYNEAKVDL